MKKRLWYSNMKKGLIFLSSCIRIVHVTSDSQFVAIKDEHYASSYYCFVALKNYPLFAHIEYEWWHWNKSALQFLYNTIIYVDNPLHYTICVVRIEG